MQFFPAAMSNGAQTSKYSGVFETAATRSGQDFSGLFSTHLEQADVASAADRIEQSPPAAMQDVAEADVQTQPDRQDDAVEDRERQSVGEEESDLKASEARHDREADVDEAQAAKAAVQEESVEHQEHDGHFDSARADQEPGEGDKSIASVTKDVDDTAVTVATEVLADVSAAVKGQGEGAGEETIAARIEALQELVHQFQQSEPSARSELAVGLGAQLRSLKEELVAWQQQEKPERRSSGQNALASSRSVSKAVRQLDELAQRFEMSGANRQAAQTGHPERSLSASAQAGTSVAMPGKAQARAAAVNAGAAGAVVAAAGTTLEHQARSTDSRPASVKQKDELQASQVQAQPVARGAENKESMLRSAVHVEPVRNSPQPEGSPQEATAAGTEIAAPSRENGRIYETRVASTASAGLAASIGGKNSVPKDKSEQQLPEQLGLNAQEDAPARRVSPSSAERKGAQNHQDARQGFFGAHQQDKPSVSKAQASGGGKIVLEGESLTGAAVQNAQAQVQQRLNSPVSARNTEVYKQVESGAFKNLGQGVKQLVIRLDPMELGQVSVILQVRGKEVQAVLRASNQETSVALNEQLSQLRTQLEAQGLKVGKLEVQTQLADGQGQSQWQGAESHNRYQENREFALSAKRWRTLDRVSPDLVRDVQNSPQREKLSQSGLDIFA
jgi:flagellar hook-length control protein FliK